MSNTLEISAKEALEVFEYMKRRKQAQMIIDEEFMMKIYRWFVTDFKPNYTDDLEFKHHCEGCMSGDCKECINFILKVDVCDCTGIYHTE